MEQTKEEKMKQMKKKLNKMAKISKTGIFLKKGFGVNLYTLMVSKISKNLLSQY